MKIRGFILFVMLLCCTELSSQHYIGAKGGIGGGSVRMKPVADKQTIWGLPTFGLSYTYMGGDKVLGAVEVDLNYTQRGYATLPRIESDTSYQRKINTVELPFMWHPHVNMFKNRFRLFLNLGPYVAYHLSSSYEVVSKERGVLESGKYEWNPARDNRLEYGLMGGGGFNIKITSRVDIKTEFRYTWSFSDILKNPNKYKTNPNESPLTLMSVMVGVNYRLGRDKPRVKLNDINLDIPQTTTEVTEPSDVLTEVVVTEEEVTPTDQPTEQVVVNGQMPKLKKAEEESGKKAKKNKK